jgi:hypothetical protein
LLQHKKPKTQNTKGFYQILSTHINTVNTGPFHTFSGYSYSYVEEHPATTTVTRSSLATKVSWDRRVLAFLLKECFRNAGGFANSFCDGRTVGTFMPAPLQAPDICYEKALEEKILVFAVLIHSSHLYTYICIFTSLMAGASTNPPQNK